MRSGSEEILKRMHLVRRTLSHESKRGPCWSRRARRSAFSLWMPYAVWVSSVSWRWLVRAIRSSRTGRDYDPGWGDSFRNVSALDAQLLLRPLRVAWRSLTHLEFE